MASSESVAVYQYKQPDVLEVKGVFMDTVEQTGGSVRFRGTVTSSVGWILSDNFIERDQLVDSDGRLSMEKALKYLEEYGGMGNGVQFFSHPSTEKYIFRTTSGRLGLTTVPVHRGDQIAVLLGCSMPAILRKVSPSHHTFITCGYVGGLMEGEALLGPLPQEWEVIREQIGHDGKIRPIFVNIRTGTKHSDDPRMEIMSSEWEWIGSTSFTWTYRTLHRYRNNETGQTVLGDPRLLPEALEARGVMLQTIAML